MGPHEKSVQQGITVLDFFQLQYPNDNLHIKLCYSVHLRGFMRIGLMTSYFFCAKWATELHILTHAKGWNKTKWKTTTKRREEGGGGIKDWHPVETFFYMASVLIFEKGGPGCLLNEQDQGISAQNWHWSWAFMIDNRKYMICGIFLGGIFLGKWKLHLVSGFWKSLAQMVGALKIWLYHRL